MNILTIVGGIEAAQEILESPLVIRSSYFNVKNKTYIARFGLIQTKPWRLITSTEPEDAVVIDEPDLDDLISLNELSAAVIHSLFQPLDGDCVIFNEQRGVLVSGIAGKGKATYYTRNANKAMKVPVSEALDIIIKMKCSDEERADFKILKIKGQNV